MRYDRHQSLAGFSPEGQARIERGNILLVGLGGLGCPAATYLAAAGLGGLILNDFDSVDESNLARQPLFHTTDIGRAKAVVAKEKLTALNPKADFQVIERRLDGDSMAQVMRSVDVVIDATDNIASRLLIQGAARTAARPVVFGAAIRWEGHYAVLRYDLGEDSEDLLTTADEQLEDCAGSGVFGPLVGVIGAAMAAEALKLLIGQSARERGQTGLMSLFDARDGSWRQLKMTPTR